MMNFIDSAPEQKEEKFCEIRWFPGSGYSPGAYFTSCDKMINSCDYDKENIYCGKCGRKIKRLNEVK